MKKTQVTIKPKHLPILREIQERLGGVSSTVAIAFLIETQAEAALKRLDPQWQSDEKFHQVPQLESKQPTDTTQNGTSPTEVGSLPLSATSTHKSEAEEILANLYNSLA